MLPCACQSERAVNARKKYRRAGKRDVFGRIFHPVQAD
ncbi:hypothetical protein QSI_1048 [Clostridioides difficile P28]|nr:hypothetical protein QSI_1048 [Clostridioides difficile P28]